MAKQLKMNNNDISAGVKKGIVNDSIRPLKRSDIAQAAAVLSNALHYEKADAVKEIKAMLKKPRVALAAMVDGHVIGIVGAIPQYGITGWELHPLAVLSTCQRIGIGTELLIALEQAVLSRGGVMIYLGSDDENGTTSLYGMELYDDPLEKLARIENTGGHPYSFYEKNGYKLVGVFPDANGIGKPDIWMAKRIKKA